LKIAILGWGSLNWNPGDLKYDKALGWQKDGPFLPIEFARISIDGRLTLVITPNGTEVQTLYAISEFDCINDTVLNLVKREGTIIKKIGTYNKHNDEFFPNDFQYKENIKKWINTTDFDAVIWTNLGESWEVKNEKRETIKTIKPENRVDYLKNLIGNSRDTAEKYIRKTPPQIKTKYREIIEIQLEWLPIE
jgi:hypothetical protein